MLETVKAWIGPERLGRFDYVFKPHLKRSWGGAFNDQAFRQRMYREILAAVSVTAIVETGTYRGTTTVLLAESGLPVYTVEFDPRFHSYAAMRLQTFSNVTLVRDDSRSFLRRLIANGVCDPVFAYLDAHWNADLPLGDELRIIFDAWPTSVVMIDDFEVPGTDYRFDDYGHGAALTLDYVRRHVDTLTAFFPAVGPEQETGLKRGSVVLAQRPETIRRLQTVPSLRH